MEEQEIDLRDYVKVIVKRWWVIAGITFISVLVSAIVVLNLPKSYESTALLELANVNKKILENISVTVMIIKNPPEPYMREIARKLKLEETESNIRGLAKSFELKETGKLIRIIGIQNSPDKAKELVEIISNIVIDRHDNLLQKEKDVINAEIAILDEQLATTKKEISTYDTLIKSVQKTDITLRILLIQSYLEAKENAWRRYNELFSRLKEKEILIKYKMETTKIVGKPAKLETPISRKGKKKVMVSFAISFMFSVFLVFLIEYFTKEPEKYGNYSGVRSQEPESRIEDKTN